MTKHRVHALPGQMAADRHGTDLGRVGRSDDGVSSRGRDYADQLADQQDLERAGKELDEDVRPAVRTTPGTECLLPAGANPSGTRREARQTTYPTGLPIERPVCQGALMIICVHQGPSVSSAQAGEDRQREVGGQETGGKDDHEHE